MKPPTNQGERNRDQQDFQPNRRARQAGQRRSHRHRRRGHRLQGRQALARHLSASIALDMAIEKLAKEEEKQQR
jgi:hypothetical protein